VEIGDLTAKLKGSKPISIAGKQENFYHQKKDFRSDFFDSA